jgi:SAM-dependent methyltransferase
MSEPAAPAPPQIFAHARRLAVRRRMATAQTQGHAPRYLLDDAAEDVLERLAFLRHRPNRALVTGDHAQLLMHPLHGLGAEVITADPAPGEAAVVLDEERPWPVSGFDLIVSLFTLDTVNDLPGALIHLRGALAPGGLALVTITGAGSLPVLRGVMFEADAERPAARIHPQVDVRAGAQLLQRAGFVDPVADARGLDVRFSTLAALVSDLRTQGLGNVLARPGPALGKAALARAESAFAAQADAAGRVTEHFELLTLSGWRGPRS